MGFEQLKERLADEASQKGSSTGDYEQRPRMKMAPGDGAPTVITYDDVVDVFFTGTVSENGEPVEQNYGMEWSGGTPHRHDGQFGIVLRNPAVAIGTAWENNHRDGEWETTDDDGNDVTEEIALARFDDDAGSSVDYVVGNEATAKKNYDSDGELKGVQLTSRHNEFDGHEVDEFAEDEIELFVSGRWGLEIVRRLDVNGLPSVYYDDETGENSNGLVEFPPGYGSEDTDLDYRIARYPELDDTHLVSPIGVTDEDEYIEASFQEYGGFIALFYKSDLPMFDDGADGYYGLVGINDFPDDEIEEAPVLRPRYDPDGVSYEYGSTAVWHDDPSDTTDADKDTTDAPDFGTSRPESGDVDLSEDEETFVETFIEATDIQEDEVVADLYDDGFDAFVGVVEEELGGDEEDADRLATAIEGRA